MSDSLLADTWVHSTAVVVAGAAALLIAGAMQARALGLGLPPDAHAPVAMLALLAPGLAIGWFTRRHPLLVGAAAAVLAEAVANLVLRHAPAPAFVGQLVASGMVVAVAALAGRALRYRFRGAPA